MAAIIAQITRAKRERDKKKVYTGAKCMYQLPPFDPHFDPMVHNKYFVRRAAWRERQEERKQLEQEVLELLREEREREASLKKKPTCCSTCLELCLIGLMMCLVPVAYIILEIIWTQAQS